MEFFNQTSGKKEGIPYTRSENLETLKQIERLRIDLQLSRMKLQQAQMNASHHTEREVLKRRLFDAQRRRAEAEGKPIPSMSSAPPTEDATVVVADLKKATEDYTSIQEQIAALERTLSK